MSADEDDQWYYSLTSGRVVRANEAKAAERLGPYPDRASAERALETARARTEAADDADRRFEGDDEDD